MKKPMLGFSSINFSKLYMRSYIPPSVKIRDLQMIDAYFNAMGFIANTVDLIKNNGGLTVVDLY